jgi:hypothetical protein
VRFQKRQGDRVIGELKSVLVTGLAHNVEFHIEKEIFKIEKHLAKIFAIVKFLIIESDSTDRTESILTNMMKKNKNLKLISFGKLATNLPYRVDRITFCRNVYVKEIRNNLEYQNTDIIAVIDFDIKNNRLNLEVLSEWLVRDDWTALFANQTGAYYDIAALRSKNWCEQDCFEEYNTLAKYMDKEEAKTLAIWSKMRKIPKSSEPILVDSAFGGLGFYRKKVFLQFDYTLHENIPVPSEHLSLHSKLNTDLDKMYILPKLTNFSWNPHNLSKYSIFRKLDKLTSSNFFYDIRKLFRKFMP